MRIFILLCIGLFLSSCQSGGELRADLNMAVLTVGSEEEFRSFPAIKEFKSRVHAHKFTTNVTLKLVVKRFLHCANNENRIVSRAWLVDNALEINNYKNTYVITASRPLTGYNIWEVWELDSISSEETHVALYIKGSFDQPSESKGKRYENFFAKGISEEDSIFYNACKF